jgi:beta-glucosidase/6-phospho-beta-glucosidase/beta-galactosidase
MKKSVMTLTLTLALVGCDDASKVIDQAQEVANKAVDTLQLQAQLIDLNSLNLEVFGDAAQRAKEFTQSIDTLMKTELGDQEAIRNVTEQISNSYYCLVEVSSQETAENLLDKIVSSVKNDQMLAIIEKGVGKANSVKECVI